MKNYLDQLLNMNVNKIGCAVAPHKPILIISIMDLIGEGLIRDNCITLSDSLIRRFKLNWKLFAGHIDPYKCDISKPYFHLSGEPFYHLKSHNGQVLSKGLYNVTRLRSCIDYAYLDDDLWNWLSESDTCRSKLRVVLISTYLAGHSFCGDDRTILKRELESFQKDFSEARDEDLGMLKDSEIARTNKVRRYSLDDETFFCKRRFALEVVRQLVRHYPNRSFEFYESLVPERVESGSILVPENVWLTKSEDGKSRFFCAEGEGFVDCHGLRFFVSNQWTGEMIEDFIVPVVKALGYTIYRKY